MATVHYAVTIECVSEAELAEQLAAVQTLPGVTDLVVEQAAHSIRFHLTQTIGATNGS